MAPSKEVVLSLRADLMTESGRKTLYRGDEIPTDTLDGDLERLRGLGAIGVPDAAQPAGEPTDEATVLAGSLTEAAITDYVRDHNIKEIVAAVGDDVELAKKVLVAEADATGNESRGGLVKALQAVIQADSGGAPADEATVAKTTQTVTPPESGEDETPPEPVDYSTWKGAELNAELEKRGIEFKPVGEKNSAKAEKLADDDAKKDE